MISGKAAAVLKGYRGEYIVSEFNNPSENRAEDSDMVLKNKDTSADNGQKSNKPFATKIRAAIDGIPKKARIPIIVSAAVVAVLLIAVLITALVKSDNVENNSILVYRKGNECIIRINDKEILIPETDVFTFKSEPENKRVYYTVASSYDEELFDLYYVELDGSEITKPAIIDYGVEKDYEIYGGKVYYLKYNKSTNSNDGCICEIDSRKITTFSANVSDIYSLGEGGIYFTKMHGSNLVLYSFSGETPQEVCRNITGIVCYADAEKPHVIYESKSAVNAGATQLYIAYAGSAPELICDNATGVVYDYYSAGGNLYYYTSSQESVSWSYVIADDFAESDKTLTKPNRLDFFDLFGVSEAYNRAYLEYQDKLIRDEIREALDETVAKGGLTAPVYTAFAYDGEKVCKIAQNVDPAKVYSYSAFGEPKIVFENTVIKEKETDMATLSEIAARSGMEEVIAYACNIVANSTESKGMAVAYDGKVFGLTDYDKSKTQFRFSENGENLFALVRDTQGERYSLFSNSFGESGVTDKVTVSANVSSFNVMDDSVVYLKTDVGKATGDVFSFDGKDTEKISNAAVDFVIRYSEYIFVLKNYNGQQNEPVADYYEYSDGDEILVGQNVVMSKLRTRKDGATAFIENKDGTTELKIYSNGKTTAVCNDATDILLFN